MKRVLAAVAVVLLALVLGVVLGFNQVVRWAMTPSAPFDAATVPTAPDYNNPLVWTALANRKDAADVFHASYPARDPDTAAVDAFYIHPTTYIGSNWNGPVDDPTLNDATDRVATRLQASAFNACCAVYGPRYRQANGMAFTHPSADGDRALDVAYQDVAAAFRVFLQRGGTRPFILAAHSQGSFLARRLLREEVSGKPARARLVAAYLPGAPWPVDDMAREVPDLPACETPEQVGCVISWNARGPHYRPTPFEFVVTSKAPKLCVNPISWRTDGNAMPATASKGALFLEGPEPRLFVDFASARCQDGTLVVETMGIAPRDFMSRLLDRALGDGNHHPVEYQMYYLDIRSNAVTRATAFYAAPRPQ